MPLAAAMTMSLVSAVPQLRMLAELALVSLFYVEIP